MDYADSIEYLYGLQKFGIKLGLQNPRALLAALGRPQDDFKAVHIAGTNGKGSTARALASMLSRTGARTGLYTSPHLISFTERISVDGAEVTETVVAELAAKVRSAAGGLSPTFFEVVTAMAMAHFSDSSVDCAVLECGLGGRLDATNVITPEVTVITPIGLDHQEHLGETLRDVAREKAGTIKPGVPVVSALQEPEAGDVINAAAKEAGAKLILQGRDFDYKLTSAGPRGIEFNYISEERSIEGLGIPNPGRYQAQNAALAIAALLALNGPNNIAEDAVREGLKTLTLPGRLHVISREPFIMIDGAHNPGAARELALALKDRGLTRGEPPTLVIGVMSDKDLRGILEPLLGIAADVIFASPDYGRAAPARELKAIAGELGFKRASTAPSVADAMRRAVCSRRPVVVTGSFFTAGEAMEAMGMKGALPGLGEWRRAC